MCKVKLLYASVILLLEADMLVNTKVGSKSSMMAHGRDVNDYQSLEMCTSRSQQRLGSVFGNYTRHHRKGHKRRITSSIVSTTAIPSVFEYNASGAALYTTASTRLLDQSTTRSLQVHEVRHRAKHRERMKQETMSRAKKMYSASSGAVNALAVPGAVDSRGGAMFVSANCSVVVAQVGTTAVLHCEVSDITENTVTWIRRKDYSLLSVGLVTYSADNRFYSAHGKHIKDWALHIRWAGADDAGYYECQVPTHPPTSIFFKLLIVEAYAEIAGEAEKVVRAGSRLRLLCTVRRATQPPQYVFWYQHHRMINYDTSGVQVILGRSGSELVIAAARTQHGGNYTCAPANARPASVSVHVVHNETPAAMQHGAAPPAPRTSYCPLLAATLLLLYAIL